jgi:glucose/arabinose dehydrogenase
VRGVLWYDFRPGRSGFRHPSNQTILWVTERTGKRVTRIDPATGERSVAITIDEVSAPGGQDGLLGMALHPELLKGTGNDYVYVAYTYIDEKKGADLDVADPASPYHYLYGKIVRLHYNATNRILSDPVHIITGLPAGDDHNGGRLKLGPENKLYFTIGDQGHNQFANFLSAHRISAIADTKGS